MSNSDSNQAGERYERHFLIRNFTQKEQLALESARVLVIGAGGLGSPVLGYLAAAGVGNIGIVDADKISLTNLQRQILYTEEEVGKRKVQQAADRIGKLNSTCNIKAFETWWTEDTAREIAVGWDVLVDCTDNYASRYLSDSISKEYSIPLVYGAIYQFEGQVAVFNYRGSKSYAEVFPSLTNAGNVSKPLGVIGPVPGVTGSIQAMETIKIITGLGDLLINKMLVFSLYEYSFRIIEY